MQDSPANKNKKVLIALVIILLALLIGVAYWKYHSNNQNTGGVNTASVGWKEFKNDKYGLSIRYPQAWGSPSIQSSSYSIGKKYTISFTDVNDRQRNVSLMMDTDNLSQKVCTEPNKCKVIPAVTEKYISEQLSTKSGAFIKSDASSYATLYNTSDSHTLQIYKKVSLPKHNISAVDALMGIQNKTKCADSQLAVNQGPCVSQQDYSNLYAAISTLEEF